VYVRYVDDDGDHDDDGGVWVGGRYIYWAFEEAGVDLPFINRDKMCRNGCCTTCAVKVRWWWWWW